MVSRPTLKTFVQGVGNTAGDALTITKPGGLVNDDVIFAIVGHIPVGGGPYNPYMASEPSGLTAFLNLDPRADHLFQWVVYDRRIDGSEPASWTWTYNVAGVSLGALLVYQDVNPVLPISYASHYNLDFTGSDYVNQFNYDYTSVYGGGTLITLAMAAAGGTGTWYGAQTFCTSPNGLSQVYFETEGGTPNLTLAVNDGPFDSGRFQGLSVMGNPSYCLSAEIEVTRYFADRKRMME